MTEQPTPTVPGEQSGVAESEMASIPTATVGASRLSAAAEITSTYMWLIALVCLLIAMLLVWWSMPDRGITIEVHFPEGHGLEAEDVVRFRGIEVGIVEDVELNADLSGVDVKVNLKPSAQAVAREGTRFWIVRPELSLAGISGLETAVGHKYIGLIPGDPEAPFKRKFDGLASSPPDALATRGMEIIIRGEKKYSVNTGSPVTCRGVEIGRILSVGLSQDSRFVDIRARILEKYTKLITTKTKFWATSGVDMEFSFGGGVTLDMESLETIARGGVSLLTVENGGEPVKPGHVFSPLYPKPDEDWYRQSSLVVATDVQLRGALPLELRWQHDGFLGESNKQSTFVGIPFRGDSGALFALVPRDMLIPPKKVVAGSMKVAPLSFSGEPLTVEPREPGEEGSPQIEKLIIPDGFSSNWLNAAATRQPTQLEDCLVVRASGEPKNLTYLHYPVETADIVVGDDGWSLNSFDGDRDVWHGSPVLSANDGKLIGILLIDKREAKVIPFDPSWLN